VPFAYDTVTIAAKDYPVLASLEKAAEYLAADPAGAAFLAGDATQQAQWLVQATRVLGRQSWQGEQLDLLAFPRSGISGVDSDSIPEAIEHGVIELASAIAAGYDAANQASTASGIKRQKAGSVEQEFFYGAAGGPDGQGFRFPLPVWELVKGLLAGAGSVIGGAIGHGVCEPSAFEPGFSLGVPGYPRDWE
jgi:hypothetical protein